MSDQEQRQSIERHLQTLIVVVIVGLLGWVGATVQSTEVAVARLTVEIEFLKKELHIDATSMIAIEKRLDTIEQQLSAHMSIPNNKP
jgi:hypothetical protein